MATKPTLAQFVWAIDANYSTGPLPTTPTKVSPPLGESNEGWKPDQKPPAQWWNYSTNNVTTWTDWVRLGSIAADLDAHIVEADGTGVARIAGAVFGGTAGAFIPVTITANTGAAGSALTVSNSSGGFALSATSDGTLAAVRGTSTGTEPGLEGRNAAGGGPGVRGVGNGGGAGVEGTAGATGNGATCVGGATSGNGVLGITGQSDAIGVHGRNIFPGAGAANPDHSAVRGTSDEGIAVSGVSTDGYGVWAEAQNTNRASLHVDPQGADPSTSLDGDIVKDAGATSFGRGGLRVFDDDGGSGGGSAGYVQVWATPGGLGTDYEESNGTTTTSASTTFVTKVTMSLGASVSPGVPAGDYDVEWHCLLSLAAGAALATRGQVEISSSVSGVAALVELDWAALGEPKPVSGFIRVPYAGGGAVDTWTIKFKTLTINNEVTIRQARLKAVGAYG